MKLDLFPLNLVLFPGAFYPLHIFEERYKNLVAKCQRDQEEFGLVLVQAGRLARVGCSARVEKVITQYADGRLDIVIVGGWRFLIRAVSTPPGGCLEGRIEELPDLDADVDPAVLGETIEAYNRLLTDLGKDAEELLDPADWSDGGASFRIVTRLGLELDERQDLLEMRSENQRLRRLLEHVRRLGTDSSADELLATMARNNGYATGEELTGSEEG